MKKYIHCSEEDKLFDRDEFFDTIAEILNIRDYSDTNLSIVGIEQYGEDFVEFLICGGLNGHGDWEDYFDDLSDFIEDCKQNMSDLKDIYMVDAENDCVDDIFYVHFRANFE